MTWRDEIEDFEVDPGDWFPSKMTPNIPFPEAKSGEWITAAGQILPIRHMGTDHLINSMAFLWRQGVKIKFGLVPNDKSEGWHRAKVKEMLAELKRRES